MTSHVYSTAAARWKPKLYVRVASSLVTITIIIILAASTTMKDSYGDIIQPALLACFVLGPPVSVVTLTMICKLTSSPLTPL